jgi:hypothetical protein
MQNAGCLAALSRAASIRGFDTMTSRFRTFSLPVLAALAIGAGPAAAAPIDGIWYAECEGDLAGDKTIIGDGRILAYNTDCRILKITRIGGEGQVWRTINSCVEDDETWIEEVLFGLESDVDGKILHLVEVGMDEGYVLTYVKCDE